MERVPPMIVVCKMDGRCTQQHRETEMFRIEPHQSCDFARHLSDYHGWSFCSKAGGSFELTPPAHKKLPDEIKSITEVNICQFFCKNFMEYETTIRAFIESAATMNTPRKKRKAVPLDTSAEALAKLSKASSTTCSETKVWSPVIQTQCTWAKCSSIATCESKFKQQRCKLHKYYRACQVNGCTARARDKSKRRQLCVKHRNAMQSAFPDSSDPVTHTFGDNDCVENNIVEKDPLVQLKEEKDKVVKTMEKFFESKIMLEKLKEQNKTLKLNHERIIQSEIEVVSEVNRIEEVLNIEVSRLENLRRSHEANQKRFEEALKESDLTRLHTIKESVSQSCKDISESQLKIYATEVTLAEKNSALFDLQMSKRKLETHEVDLEKAKEEFKAICADVHNARVEENMLFAKLMLE